MKKTILSTVFTFIISFSASAKIPQEELAKFLIFGGSPAQTDQVINALSEIYSTNVGKKLIMAIPNEAEYYGIQITDNVYGGGTAATTLFVPNEEFTGFYTEINLNFVEGKTIPIANTEQAPASLARILIHELGHGVYGYLDPENGMPGAPVSAGDVIHLIENEYAKEKGEPLRTHY